jgi:hypothetical protein
VDANEKSSSNSLLVPNETPVGSNTICHNGYPSILISKNGMPFSPQHKDNDVGLFNIGEQLSHMYMGSNTHSFTRSLSRASKLGATIVTHSRLPNHAINFNNLKAMSFWCSSAYKFCPSYDAIKFNKSVFAIPFKTTSSFSWQDIGAIVPLMVDHFK